MPIGSRAKFDLDAELRAPFDLDSELGLDRPSPPTSPLWGVDRANFRSRGAAISAAKKALRAFVGSAYVPTTKNGIINTSHRLEVAYDRLNEAQQVRQEDTYECGVWALFFLYGKAT